MNKQISISTKAVIVWAICVVGLLLCGGIFRVLSRAASLPDIALLAYPVVGLVSLALIWCLLSTPVRLASINPDGEVTFTWRYLTRSERKVFQAASLAEPTVEEQVDSDNDSHWSVQLVLPDGSVFVIADYGVWSGSGKNEKTRKRCDAKRAQFVETLSRARSV